MLCKHPSSTGHKAIFPTATISMALNNRSSFSLQNLTTSMTASGSPGNDKKRKRVSWNEEELEEYSRDVRQRKETTNTPEKTPAIKSGIDSSLKKVLSQREGRVNRLLLLSNVSDATHIKKVKDRFEKVLAIEGITYYDNPIEKSYRRNDGSRMIVLEFINSDMASRALCLNNYILQEGRPPITLCRPFEYNADPSLSRHPTSFEGFCSAENKQVMKEYAKKDHQSRVVCIKNLSTDIPPDSLRRSLSKFLQDNSLIIRYGCPIVAFKVKQSKSTGEVCAFVTFRTNEEAIAFTQKGSLKIGGRLLRITGAKLDSSPTKINPVGGRIPSMGIKEASKKNCQASTGNGENGNMHIEEPEQVEDESTMARKKELEDSLRQIKLELQKATDSQGFLVAQLEKANREKDETEEKLCVVEKENSELQQHVSNKKKQLEEVETSLASEVKKNEVLGNTMHHNVISATNELKNIEKKLVRAKEQLVSVRTPLRRVSLVPHYDYDMVHNAKLEDLQPKLSKYESSLTKGAVLIKPEETYPIKFEAGGSIFLEI